MVQGTQSPVTVSVTKAKLSEPTGLILTKNMPDGTIRISGIKYGSLFWSTGLKNGYQVLSINGTQCERNMPIDAATRILQNSRDVTVVAIDDGTTTVNPNPTRTKGDFYQNYTGVPPPKVETKMPSLDDTHSAISPAARPDEEPDIMYNNPSATNPSQLSMYVTPSSKLHKLRPSSPMHNEGPTTRIGTGNSVPPRSPNQKMIISDSTPPSMPNLPEKKIVIPLDIVPNPIPNQAAMSSFPPRGAADGGKWGKTKEVGDQTWLVCVILCLCTGIFSGFGTAAFCCPCDEKDAYMVNNKIYNASGQEIGTTQNKDFRPLPRHQQPGASANTRAPQAGVKAPQ